MTRVHVRRPAEQRFWAKVDTTGGMEACWPYQGAARGPEGYGAFWVDGRHEIASRVAYRLANGEIPLGHDVCHSCDNPPCCNPLHLFAAPHSENIADKVAKRRQAAGERVGSAKLTGDQVRAIRARLTGRRGEQAALAREYGISQSTMSQIARGLWWRHAT